MQISVQPSHDIGFFNRLVNHPEISPHVRDDRYLGEIDFSLLDNGANILLKILSDDEPAGFALLTDEQDDTYELHSGILPGFRGSIARQIGRQVVNWVAENTNANRLITCAWDNAKNVVFMARLVGFEEQHREQWPYTVHGENVCRVVFSIDLNHHRETQLKTAI
jgi:RimJ/RimL family protein N-acetyltransferase